MAGQPLDLTDADGVRLAALDVQFRDGRYEGGISLENVPPPIRHLFELFEEIVNGQILSLLDDIDAKIAALSLRVRFDDGALAEVTDLQMFPSTGAVSFAAVHPGLTMTDAQKRELDRRLAELDADPGIGLTWEQVKHRIRAG